MATLGREPNHAELAMFAAMWSEHCSYKSSKVHLRTLPTEGPAVLVGPGQDAGVVDLGDGMAGVFKMESHSHPSAIEPYQGAATGVGGIVRDILSMGARPVALLDPLRFGPLTDPRNRWLFGGVVAGIGGYGNCIGVPTVGGEVRFAEPHSANPTVNVMCVGFAPVDGLVTSARARRRGTSLVLIGAPTGRDGIGGVSVLASATLEDDAQASRPSVQIGDPFTEKLLIEACLELNERGLLEGLQDLGGAGLTCAVCESAARVGMGADLDLDAVPLREPGMEPFEILTSESQERMLAIVAPDARGGGPRGVRAVGAASAVIGDARAGRHAADARPGARSVADVPAARAGRRGARVRTPDGGARWRRPRPHEDPAVHAVRRRLRRRFVAVLGSPNVASKRWVFEQYDSLVQGETVAGPGADAAVIRLEGTIKAVAVSSDGNGRYGHLDPYLGGAHAVAEAARNVAAAGARPLAITNCLNFGNPERPEVMWQFAESMRGMGDACRALGHAGHRGERVVLQRVRRLGDLTRRRWSACSGCSRTTGCACAPGVRRAGAGVYLLGETIPELGGSEFAEVVLGMVPASAGARPASGARRCTSCCTRRRGTTCWRRRTTAPTAGWRWRSRSARSPGGGFTVTVGTDLPPYVSLFSESASRAVVTVCAGARAVASWSWLDELGVPARRAWARRAGPRGGVRRPVRDVGRRAARGVRDRDPPAARRTGLTADLLGDQGGWAVWLATGAELRPRAS